GGKTAHMAVRRGNRDRFGRARRLDRGFNRGFTHRGFTHRGFTLVEMLVVLGIILLLSALLLSAAVSARKAARQTLCLTQLRSIGLAATNYSMRYQGALPLGSWADLPGGANGDPSEAPMSVKGLPDLKGNVKDLLGEGAGALPTVRDVLQSFMNTKDPVWRC